MKKTLGFLVALLIAAPAFANQEVTGHACDSIYRSLLLMDITSDNIANINTTRTPEGGPYKPASLVCNDQTCNVTKESKSILKYEPDNIDANEDGYVAYPEMDLMTEMANMIVATQQYEEALPGCQR